ncbi:MAG: glucose-6-phosphate isomerase [Buchnera aphidicola (Kaburagia rhusicola ensigallis)]
MKNINPVDTHAWKNLKKHFHDIKNVHMKDLFYQDKERFHKFSINFNDQMLVDFSKNRITSDTIVKLLMLAKEVDLVNAIQLMFNGEKINRTENRAALHTALRNSSQNPIMYNDKDVMIDIRKMLKKMKLFSKAVIGGEWKGYTGKSITDVVNIGIGGSDLGPSMVVTALSAYKNHLKIHFVSNMDGAHISSILKKVHPETTLFLIVSKTFTTQETIMNANTAKLWMTEYFHTNTFFDQHFIAISASVTNVINFGIKLDNTFIFWDWVGGRYSLWSSVGLSVSLAIGFDNFLLLLNGAYSMDQHYLNTNLSQNIPVLLALIGIWYNNFFLSETEAILPYDQNMRRFPTFLQQTNMESNGKNIDRNGNRVGWQTGPIVWGEQGTNGQHAFYQLLHQGTKLIPCDFIASVCPNNNSLVDHHVQLLSHFFSQTQALAFGQSHKIEKNEFNNVRTRSQKLWNISPYKTFEGNRPSNSILLYKIDPYNLGSLIALYEHKVFTQGVIFNIFTFDQWGVELGKKLAKSISFSLINDVKETTYDSSTNGLINFYKSLR